MSSMEALVHGWSKRAGSSEMAAVHVKPLAITRGQTVTKIGLVFQEQRDQERPYTANILGGQISNYIWL